MSQDRRPDERDLFIGLVWTPGARRGKQRAIMAVAHSIMVSVFHMLTRQEPYREWGARYCDERRHYTVDRLAQRIERLGYRVHLKPAAATAA